MTESDPRAVIQLTGRSAAGGFAVGPIVRLDADAGSDRVVGDAQAEKTALRGALDAASAALAGLIGRLDDEEAAAILEFQLALLEDEALTDPVFAAIAEGAAADWAWRVRLDDEIAGYRAAEDDYFRARAADLEDLKGRVIVALSGGGAAIDALPDGAIVVADDLPPSRFLEISWRQGHGIALSAGSPTAHVAILARGRGIPMVVGLGFVPAANGEIALLDAAAGTLTLAPDRATRARFDVRREAGAVAAARAGARVHEPAVTASGERVAVHINIGGPADLASLDSTMCDGIGLVRTEFLFDGRTADRLPGEDEQAEAYRKILAWAAGRPVTIRTVDAGGDKPVPGYTIEGELNPFLGLRGVRLSLTRPEIFRVQLRALLRAATAGPLQIMVPMVSVPREMTAVRSLLMEEAAALDAVGIARGAIGPGGVMLGMMVEVPAAALTLDRFDTDFVSIGSNDLTQYTMAAGRDAPSVAELADAADPAVIRLVSEVVAVAKSRGIPVSLCGDAGGDPRVIPHLLGAGLRSVSVAPAVVAAAKEAIRAWPSEHRGD
jgi:phosphotransferase system enzyme I (PtsI)